MCIYMCIYTTNEPFIAYIYAPILLLPPPYYPPTYLMGPKWNESCTKWTWMDFFIFFRFERRFESSEKMLMRVFVILLSLCILQSTSGIVTGDNSNGDGKSMRFRRSVKPTDDGTTGTTHNVIPNLPLVISPPRTGPSVRIVIHSLDLSILTERSIQL